MLARRMVQLVHCIVDGYFIRTYVYRWILYVQKILKRLPKEDGMSILDWEEHYINKTRHLWADEQKQLLEELVSPVPELFRDVAKSKIAGKIGELALQENASQITQDLIIKGYIIATPKRDHKFLIKNYKKKD